MTQSFSSDERGEMSEKDKVSIPMHSVNLGDVDKSIQRRNLKSLVYKANNYKVDEPCESQDETSADDNITKITVHHCEKLKCGMSLKQPVVCMHVVDAETGSYIKKSQRNRSVMSYYESQRNDLDYIIPIMTKPCSIQGERYLEWDESFILNEKFNYIVKEDLNAIIFFEIIDMLSQPNVTNKNSNGMRKIAWAFLKVVGQNGAPNIGSKMPLGLYKAYPNQKNAKSSKIEVHNWWAKCHRIPTQGCLYVSIEACHLFVINPALRSMLPLQQEAGTSTLDQGLNVVKNPVSVSSAEQNCDTTVRDQSFELSFSRKSNEMCKVPDQLHTTIDVTGNCLELKFSPSGRYLLAACGSQEHYYLLLTEIPSGKILQKEFAHCQVIYDIDWSYNDSCVLSASSDYSVKIWNVKPWNLLSSLVHPSFVYAAKFKPAFENIVATASYDHIIRIWKVSKGTSKAFELEGHVGSVCALEWQKSGKVIYTADSVGLIKVWTVLNLQRKDDSTYYVLEKEINLQSEISSIKQILSDNDKTLYLFCTDSVKILDVYSGSISNYTSDNNVTELLLWNGCIGCRSPCGTFIFICHDDGRISVWNKFTSEVVCVIENKIGSSKLSSIDYHPTYHMMAKGVFEENGPIEIYVHNQQIVTSEVLKKSSTLSHYSLRSRASSSTKSEEVAIMGSEDPPNDIEQSSTNPPSLARSSKRAERRKKLKENN